jgi:hypothetical protein
LNFPVLGTDLSLSSESQAAERQLNDCEVNIQRVHFNTALLDTNPTLRRFLHDAESVTESVRGSIAVTSEIQSNGGDNLSVLSPNAVFNLPSTISPLPQLQPIPEVFLVPDAHPVPQAHHITGIETSNEIRREPIAAPNPPTGQATETQLQRILRRWNSGHSTIKVFDMVSDSYTHQILHAAVSPDSRHLAVLSNQLDKTDNKLKLHMTLWTLSGEMNHVYGFQNQIIWTFYFDLPLLRPINQPSSDFQNGLWVIRWAELNLAPPYTPSHDGRSLLYTEENILKSVNSDPGSGFQADPVMELSLERGEDPWHQRIRDISIVCGQHLLLVTRPSSLLLINLQMKSVHHKWTALDLDLQIDRFFFKPCLSASMNRLFVRLKEHRQMSRSHIVFDISNSATKPRIVAPLSRSENVAVSPDGSFLVKEFPDSLHVIDTLDCNIKFKIRRGPALRHSFLAVSQDGNTIMWEGYPRGLNIF